jgi:hypothetical protein
MESREKLSIMLLLLTGEASPCRARPLTGSLGSFTLKGFYSFIVALVKRNQLKILPETNCLQTPVNHLTAPRVTCYFENGKS